MLSQLGTGQYRQHPVDLQGCLGLDAQQLRMRLRAAHKGNVAGIGNHHVLPKAARTAQQGTVFAAQRFGLGRVQSCRVANGGSGVEVSHSWI